MCHCAGTIPDRPSPLLAASSATEGKRGSARWVPPRDSVLQLALKVDIAQRPVVAAVAGAAVAVFAADLAGRDTSRLVLDVRAFHGEPWRVLTTVLPHADVLHLGFNLLWLARLGSALERGGGSLATAGVVLLGAAIPGVAQYALAGTGIGLSGVVYAMAALLWVLRRDVRFVGAMTHRDAALLVAWFFFCIGTTWTGVWAVANVAHGAGALVGLAVGATVRWRGVRRALVGLALVALGAASFAGATRLRPLVNLDPEVGSDASHLGWVALEEGRNAEAMVWLTEATRVAPQCAACWSNLGVARHRAADLAGEVEAFRRANAIDPAPAARKNLAGSLARRAGVADLEKRWHDAAALYREAILVDDSAADLHLRLGAALAFDGSDDEAVLAYRAADERAEGAPHVRAMLVLMLARASARAFEAGRHAHAASLAEEATGLDRASRVAWINLAAARAALGDADGAAEAARRAEALP